jgi:hypothetical protein
MVRRIRHIFPLSQRAEKTALGVCYLTDTTLGFRAEPPPVRPMPTSDFGIGVLSTDCL